MVKTTLLALALLCQLWNMATCCQPDRQAALHGASASMEMCAPMGAHRGEGVGEKSGDHGGGLHEEACAALCAMAGLAILAALFFFLPRTLPGSCAKWTCRVAAAQPYAAHNLPRGPPVSV